MTPLETAMHVAHQLVGMPCWFCFAGEGTGSRFGLLPGGKVPRGKPLRNSTISGDASVFDGEYALYVKCPWRIETLGVVTTSWQESNEADGPMCRGLNSIVGETTISVHVLEPALDLVVEFSGEKLLRLFCDTTYETDYMTNWSIFGPDDLYVGVGPRGQVSTDRHAPADQW